MCLQSKLIYNPFAESLKLEKFVFEFEGHTYILPQLRNINWYTHAHSITGFTTDQRKIYDLVHNTQLILNGCKIPVYVECKCGKCSECLKEKQSNFVSRCLLELLTNPYPVFVKLNFHAEMGFNLVAVFYTLSKVRFEPTLQRIDRTEVVDGKTT